MKEINFGEVEQQLQEAMKKFCKKGEEYPQFFGGTSTIDNVTTFYLLNETKEQRKMIEEIVPNVKFDVAKVSKQTLLTYFYKIDTICMDSDCQKKCKELEVEEYYIDDVKGKIMVGIHNLNEKKIRDVQDLFLNIPYLEFEECATYQNETNPGEKWLNGNTYGTIGFPAYNTAGINGFITTTHNEFPIGTILNNPADLPLGTITATQYAGTVDACFVTFTGTGNVDNICAYSRNHLNFTLKFCYLKPTVTKDGATTSNTVGTIRSHHAGVPADGFTDLYRCTYPSLPGDSGGPVHWGPFLIAIHIRGNGHRTLSCKYQNIRDAFGIRLN